MDTAMPTPLTEPEPAVAPDGKRKGTRKRERCARECMAAAARRGDLHEVLRIMRENSTDSAFGTRDFRDGQQFITRAMEKLRSHSAADMVEALFNEILQFEARLLFRAQHHIDREIKQFDRQCPTHGELPANVAKEWLPRLQGLHESLERTARYMARVLHTLRLSEAEAKGKARRPRIVPLQKEPARAEEMGDAAGA